MEDRIQDSALLHSIMEAAVDAILVTDWNGMILRANPAASRMFGFDLPDMIGRGIDTLIPRAFAKSQGSLISRCLEAGPERSTGSGRDPEGLRKDNSLFPLHISIGEAGISGQRMFVVILRDLTYRGIVRDALARSRRLDAIGQMTDGIAHDFNNLLTVVIGNLELIEMGGKEGAHMSLLRDALEAAELGAELTSRLKIFASESDTKPLQTDLRVLCDETIAVLKRSIGAHVQIRNDYAEDASMVRIDPAQLQSALMNLALNARDAMRAGGHLLISVRNVTVEDLHEAQETGIPPGDYVRLSVGDVAEATPEEVRGPAFEPAFATQSEVPGSSLGLAMVYRFVHQSGGHITVCSASGRGTRFGLYFPTSRSC